MSDDRRPPQIVAAASDPAHALMAFIGQELEQWGFQVALAAVEGPGMGLVVNADGRELIVMAISPGEPQ